jgi:chemotaxis signal transduction protein
VVRLDETTFQDTPELIKAQVKGFVRAVVTVAGRLFLVADVERLIGEEFAS